MILVAVFRQVIDQQRVNVETILGALCVYFLIGLLFTMLYAGVDAVTVAPLFGHAVTNEDTRTSASSRSTTVGYGDLVAHSDLGRRIAVIEAMTGQIFLATAVARLVSLYGARSAAPTARTAARTPRRSRGPEPSAADLVGDRPEPLGRLDHPCVRLGAGSGTRMTGGGVGAEELHVGLGRSQRAQAVGHQLVATMWPSRSSMKQ